MRLQDELRRARGLFLGLTFYEAFEHAAVLVLTLLIVLIVLSATWHLALAVFALIVANQIDPANQEVFQAVFGMIFTVIIAAGVQTLPADRACQTGKCRPRALDRAHRPAGGNPQVHHSRPAGGIGRRAVRPGGG